MMKSKSIYLIFFLSLFIVINLMTVEIVAQQREDSSKSKNLKQQVKSISLIETTELQLLFEIGDTKIENLITLLDDEDSNVKKNAQILLRYLGNNVGIKELYSKLRKGEIKVISGPINIPLDEWDYQFINDTLLSEKIIWNNYTREYVLVLALDSSPNAKKVLSLVRKNAEENNITDSIFQLTNLYLDKNLFVYDKSTIEEDVLGNLSFLGSQYKVKSITYNQQKNRAFLEIANDYTKYHVIISVNDCFWKFSSINQVVIS